MALAAYRHILRSTRIAFQGDTRLLLAARTEARNKYNLDRILPIDTPQAKQKILEAEQVAVILRQNIVQGQHVPGKAGDGEAEEEQRYQLRIHKDTEKGNNEDKNMRGSGGLLDDRGRGCGGADTTERLRQKMVA